MLLDEHEEGAATRESDDAHPSGRLDGARTQSGRETFRKE
jgi:hypothetical protein